MDVYKKIERLGQLTILQKIMDGKVDLIRTGNVAAEDRSRLLSELADIKAQIEALKGKLQ